jgi:hypothetical protein
VALWLNPAAGAFGTGYRLFDFAGCVAIAGMTVMLVISSLRNTVTLYREETVR